MDNEFGITGKSYTTEFREYNTDIGRWWSLDPKPTASESWYAGMGNNPIVFSDPRGLEVEVGGNTEFAENTMVKGLVEPEYHDRISFCNNIASFDITGLDAGLFDKNSPNFNSGVALLNNLVNSPEKYLFYGIDENNTDLPLVNSLGKEIENPEKFAKFEIISTSITPKLRDINTDEITGEDTYKPINGYSAVFGLNTRSSYTENVLTVQTKSFLGLFNYNFSINEPKPKPLLSIVFHEGWELWDRTDNKNVYDYTRKINGNNVEIRSNKGAHFQASEFEKWFWNKSQKPGDATEK